MPDEEESFIESHDETHSGLQSEGDVLVGYDGITETLFDGRENKERTFTLESLRKWTRNVLYVHSSVWGIGSASFREVIFYN